MPKITMKEETIECAPGTTLRRALLDAGISPHNGRAKLANCRGFGSCGTCAVKVVSGNAGEKTAMERWRLNFPPHDASSGLRLACQIKVEDDLEIHKHPGFWGQHVAREETD